MLPLAAMAQESSPPEFETDRPDRTEASSVVPKGYYQLETGFRYQKDRKNGIEQKEWMYPQALLRIGVFEKAELRLEGTYRRQDYRHADLLFQQHKGLSNLRVGTKIKLAEENGVLPETSVLGMLEMPLGHDQFEPEKVAPQIRLLFTNKLTQNLKLQYNVGYRRQKEQGDMENKLQYTAAFSGKLSEKLTLFAEFFGEKTKESRPKNQVDGGLQFMVLPNLQIDAIAGAGISSAAPEFFLGGGISLRLPQ